MRQTLSWTGLMAAFLLAMMPSVGRADAPVTHIESGDDLYRACAMHLEDDAQGGAISRVACEHYLQGLLDSYLSVGPLTGPIHLVVMTGGGAETSCFDLPRELTYDEFGKVVLEVGKDDASLRSGPAFVLAAKALAVKYPCM